MSKNRCSPADRVEKVWTSEDGGQEKGHREEKEGMCLLNMKKRDEAISF